MKSRFIFQALGPVVLFLTASCAPAPTTSTVNVIPTAPSAPQPTETVNSSASQTTSIPIQDMEVQAIATSRGPNLEATNPAIVELASGQLQLVEFFRFT
jgi:hypothetical protein